MTLVTGLPLLVLLQLQIPEPVGFVNDFAGVIDDASRTTMLAVIEEVRAKSRGEIVVVTLTDLGGRPAAEVARDIGREWKVGAMGQAGDPARNAGVVLLLKPGVRPGDGQADLFIATGTGAEGFITDARAGRVRDAIGRTAVRDGSYAAGLLVGVALLAQAYADEFGFELTGATVRPPVPRGTTADRSGVLLVLFFVLMLTIALPALAAGGGGPGGPLRRRRGGLAQALLLGAILGGHRRRGGWGGGWGGGFGGGGFGGGGFGGFGGGGGFSGGGAGGSF